MSAPYEGSCNCGAITATFASEPMAVRQCWCRKCQKAAAGGPTTNALFATDTMDLRGAVKWSGYEADSGNTVEQGFCPECGTPIFGRNSARQGSWMVRLGFLDGDHGLFPDMAIWLDQAPAWASVPEGIETCATQPAPRPAKS